jgi:hypothetical protein
MVRSIEVIKAILDKKQFGNGYEFISTPVWYSTTVDVPEGTAEAVTKLIKNFYTVQMWLDSCYDSSRAGLATPEMPNEIKEILWPVTAPVEPESAKQPKKRASAAASNTPSPKA